MSRTLPPWTSLVLDGSSGFCGSPQEELNTPEPPPLPPALPPQADAARTAAAAPAAHLAYLAPRMECLLGVRRASSAGALIPYRSISGHFIPEQSHHIGAPPVRTSSVRATACPHRAARPRVEAHRRPSTSSASPVWTNGCRSRINALFPQATRGADAVDSRRVPLI